MQQYLDLLDYVLTNGKKKDDPQGVGNLAVFSYKLRFDLDQGFPLMTTKKLWFKAIVHELLWFLRGDRRVDYLKEHGVTIWDEWATPEACARYGHEPGDLGMIYGPLWRTWPMTNGKVIDQVQKEIIDTLKTFPDSRRLMVSGWNPEFINDVFVAPCHGVPWKIFHADGEISIINIQRSADIFLGVPFNIASYALLLMMIGKVTGFKPKEVVLELIDTHLYTTHIEQAKLQLTRKPRPLPKLTIPDIKDLSLETVSSLKYEDFKLEGYDPHPGIRAEPGI